jgi:hypothetical protein
MVPKSQVEETRDNDVFYESNSRRRWDLPQAATRKDKVDKKDHTGKSRDQK